MTPDDEYRLFRPVAERIAASARAAVAFEEERAAFLAVLGKPPGADEPQPVSEAFGRLAASLAPRAEEHLAVSPATAQRLMLAAARTAIPALIAEVERLRAQQDEALVVVDPLGNLWRRYNDVGWVMLITISREQCAAAATLAELEDRVGPVRVLSRTEDGNQ